MFCSKIGKLTLARLLTALDSLSSPHDKRIIHTEEVLQFYADLMKLDPTHSLYYKDEHSLMLIKQVLYSSVLNVYQKHDSIYRSLLLTMMSGTHVNINKYTLPITAGQNNWTFHFLSSLK